MALVGTALAVVKVASSLIQPLLADLADRSKKLTVADYCRILIALTLVLLVLNFLTAMGSEFLGQVLHYILVIVSSPMICSGHWAMSIFLWACLLMVSLRQLKR